jgi:hypothetical protein
MKNTQTPPPSALNRVFSVVSAVAVAGFAGLFAYHGAYLHAFSIALMGFACRYFVLFCAKQDREFNAQQKRERDEIENFFY